MLAQFFIIMSPPAASSGRRPGPPPALAALALARVRPAAARAADPPVIPAAEWVCPPAPDRASLGVDFKTAPVPGPVIKCGTEALWNTTTSDGKNSMPTFYFPAADLNAVYTLIIVDRDMPNATSPALSPQVQMALTWIPGFDIGVAPGFDVSDVETAVTLYQYHGPQPPAFSGCHRYYSILYLQPDGSDPALSPAERTQFDFPTWATKNKLVKKAENFWQTQNAPHRTGPC